MAKWQPQYPINTNSGGDTVYDGFVKANNEYQAIYDRLNELRIVRASASPPADAEQYELWLDTSTTPPKLKYYDGANWVDADELIPQGSGSGLDADKVDGADASATPTANTIPIADANGFLNAWIHQGAGSGLDADLVRGLPADFSSALASSGYQKLPSGLIIQWGKALDDNANGTIVITFPIAFTAWRICVATPDKNSSASNQYFVSEISDIDGYSQLAQAGFRLVNHDGTTHATGTDGIFWIAIGQ